MSVNQYMIMQLELIKEITIDGKVIPSVKFELNLPYGIPFAEAEQICDDFKITLMNMRARKEEEMAAQKASQEATQAPVEPEIVA